MRSISQDTKFQHFPIVAALTLTLFTLIGCQQEPVSVEEKSAEQVKPALDPSPESIAAAETLEKMGCTLVMEAKYSGSPVTVVDFRRATDLENGLPLLHHFDNLISVDLSGTKLSDDGMKSLKSLTNLQQLYLNNTKITDAGISELLGLTKLHTLELKNTSITDDGATVLAQLKSLTSLSAANTLIGDAGLESLKTLTILQRLDVHKDVEPVVPSSDSQSVEAAPSVGKPTVRISDAGLKSLKMMSNLKYLNLAGNDITDEGFLLISELTNIETLFLSHTGVGDQGIAHAESMKRVNFIDVYDTKVTEEEAKKVKGKVPGLSINLQP